MQIIDKDFSKSIFKNLKMLNKTTISTGILDDSVVSNTGVKVVEYAAYNEFGTDTIPARPFLGSTVDNKRNQWIQEAARIVDAVIENNIGDISSSLESLGNTMKNDIKATIESNMPPPNAESTLRQKESKQTLIDTGLMLDTIDYKISTEGN